MPPVIKKRSSELDLLTILKSIDGKNFSWCVLYIWATGHLGEKKNILELEEEVNNSDNGLVIEWNELMSLAQKLDQINELLIIASKDYGKIHRYKNDEDMYNTCDIIIEMDDSTTWNIFLNDVDLLNYEFTKI